MSAWPAGGWPDAWRWPAAAAEVMAASMWCARERIAFVGAIEGHFAGIASIRRLRGLNAVMAGCLHDMSFLVPTPRLVARLNCLAPTVVATYPSAAVLLADEGLAGQLRVRPPEVWTGGETLSPPMRRHVEAAFGCSVVDSYGTSEFLALASPCRVGRLNVNADWALLESVDAAGQPVPPGQLGATCLLTHLANFVQPLIRALSIATCSTRPGAIGFVDGPAWSWERMTRSLQWARSTIDTAFRARRPRTRRA